MIVDNVIFDNRVEDNMIEILRSLNKEEMDTIIRSIDFTNKAIVVLKKKDA